MAPLEAGMPSLLLEAGMAPLEAGMAPPLLEAAPGGRKRMGGLDTIPTAGSAGCGALAFQGGDFGSTWSPAFGERALAFQGGDDGEAARRRVWAVISAGGDVSATLTESSMVDHGTPTLEGGCGSGCKSCSLAALNNPHPYLLVPTQTVQL